MERPIRNFGEGPARVVIAGGGVGALEALLALRSHATEELTIDVVSPTRDFVYRPLAVLAPFAGDDAPHFDMKEMAIDCGARYHEDALASVDANASKVNLDGGGSLDYDALVVAVGAIREPGVEGALTFFGPDDTRQFADLLVEAERGVVDKIVFAVPPGIVWTLPLYELALNTASYLATREHHVASISIVTPEDAPLGVFGTRASDAVRELLRESGVELRTRTYATGISEGAVKLVPEGELEADRVVALPRLRGPAIPGLPADDDGFIPIDEHCLVHGLDDVYAVGDATAFPVKQGGITAEQADTAAEAIASRAGVAVEPRPFRPVLRGLLLAGGETRYLSAHITRGPAIASEAEEEPLWWPPTKIPGRHIARYLSERGKELARPGPPPQASVPFEVDLGEPGSGD
jgi:sulfide:quinone oxidoreductase